jgi:hypothetical protein
LRNAYSPPETPSAPDLLSDPGKSSPRWSLAFYLFRLPPASMYLNVPGQEKLRKQKWLISAISLNFNHLEGMVCLTL